MPLLHKNDMVQKEQEYNSERSKKCFTKMLHERVESGFSSLEENMTKSKTEGYDEWVYSRVQKRF